jgi:DNA-binding MarR family transcriptional regulator
MTTDEGRRGSTTRLAEEFGRLFRLAQLLKSAAAREDQSGVQDRSAFLLLPLLLAGPQRPSAIADAVRADPSTVSRQTAELVQHGLVERQPDPSDGRAFLLAITPEGTRVCADNRARRQELLDRALAGWSDEDLGTLATLLGRFNEDVEAQHDARVPPPRERAGRDLSTTRGTP